MELGIEFVPHSTLEDLGKLSTEVERAGFDYIWVCDHYRDRFVHSTLIHLAQNTDEIRLGPSVTNPYLIHPSVTATAIATLDEFSGGRATLGISAGDLSILKSLGIRQDRPITTVKEAVQVIEKLWNGERTTFSGEKFTCEGAKLKYSPEQNPPVYIGGRGPQMLELAGSLAEGVLINATHPKDIKECLHYIKRGAEKANREMEDLNIASHTATSINEDEERAKEMAKTATAFVASSAPKSTLDRENLSEENIKKIRGYIGSGRMDRAREFVTEKMIEVFSISGKMEKLETRAKELERLGVDQIIIGSPIGVEIDKTIRKIGESLK